MTAPKCSYCGVKMRNSARWRGHLTANACGRVPSLVSVPAGRCEMREVSK